MLGKIEGRSRRGRHRMRWLDGISNSMEFEQALGIGDGQGSLACCSPWGHKESDTTEQLNWNWIYRSLVYLGRYIPKYFILFVAMVNGTRSLSNTIHKNKLKMD